MTQTHPGKKETHRPTTRGGGIKNRAGKTPHPATKRKEARMLSVTAPQPAHHAIINAAHLQPSTKIKYIRAMDALMEAGIDPRNRPALAAYAANLSGSSRQFLKSALRLLSREAVTTLQAAATPENLSTIQAQLLNLEAISKTIPSNNQQGEKVHIWLSQTQVEQITAKPARNTLRGMRDYIVLSVLLAAGLRRSELVNLTFDDIHTQPAKAGIRYILSVTGKGDKPRIIPISNKLATHLQQWKKITGNGRIARSIHRSGALGSELSEIGIHNIVRQYGAMIGIPELDSHDLRRTYAQIGYGAGVPLTQISRLLGHSDIKTTIRYLDLSIDLENTASDFVPLSGD